MSVSGGAAGLSATYAAVRALADRFDTAGDRLRAWAADDGRVLIDPDVLETATLSPLTFAEAEAGVASAASGAHGAVEMSVAYETDALLLRTTVAAFEECDRLVASSLDAVDYAL